MPTLLNKDFGDTLRRLVPYKKSAYKWDFVGEIKADDCFISKFWERFKKSW